MKKIARETIATISHVTGLGNRKFDGKVYICACGYLSKKEAEDYADYIRKGKGWLARVIKTRLYKWSVYYRK